MKNSLSDKTIINIILLISASILIFLIWLIYFQSPSKPNNFINVKYLPVLNAVLNSFSAVSLLVGYWAIKRRKRIFHRNMMLLALIFSAFFLISYLIYHSFHGNTPFLGTGWIRPFYFFILISHVILSGLMLPLILISLYFALIKKFEIHPKVARIALPIWLYVSVTGVLVYIMLYQLYPS